MYLRPDLQNEALALVDMMPDLLRVFSSKVFQLPQIAPLLRREAAPL